MVVVVDNDALVGGNGFEGCDIPVGCYRYCDFQSKEGVRAKDDGLDMFYNLCLFRKCSFGDRLCDCEGNRMKGVKMSQKPKKPNPEYLRYMNGHCVVCGEEATEGEFAETEEMPGHRRWMELCPKHLERVQARTPYGINPLVGKRKMWELDWTVGVKWGGEEWWFKPSQKPL